MDEGIDTSHRKNKDYQDELINTLVNANSFGHLKLGDSEAEKKFLAGT
jgi:hypothetical protein